MRRSLLCWLPAVLLVALGGAPAAQASGGLDIQVVASALSSPRHLAFGTRRRPVRDRVRPAAATTSASPGPRARPAWGASGAVTEVDRHGHQFRIIDKLPSMANTPGDRNGIGPHGIAVLGADQVFITNGGPTEPKDAAGHDIPRADLAKHTPQADLFGRVLWIRHHRAVKAGDVWRFERDHNPDAAVADPAINSNPVDLLFDGHKIVVADAGGNALDVVRPFGRLSNLTVFPGGPGHTPAYQAVPTSVVKGPDGDYYVSQLTGFPFPVGGANIYRVDPRTGAATVFASGFTNLMDLAFGRDGTMYALSYSDNGLLGGTTVGAIYAVAPRGQAQAGPARRHAERAGRDHRRPERALRVQPRWRPRERAGAEDQRSVLTSAPSCAQRVWKTPSRSVRR